MHKPINNQSAHGKPKYCDYDKVNKQYCVLEYDLWQHAEQVYNSLTNEYSKNQLQVSYCRPQAAGKVIFSQKEKVRDNLKLSEESLVGGRNVGRKLHKGLLPEPEDNLNNQSPSKINQNFQNVVEHGMNSCHHHNTPSNLIRPRSFSETSANLLSRQQIKQQFSNRGNTAENPQFFQQNQQNLHVQNLQGLQNHQHLHQHQIHQHHHQSHQNQSYMRQISSDNPNININCPYENSSPFLHHELSSPMHHHTCHTHSRDGTPLSMYALDSPKMCSNTHSHQYCTNQRINCSQNYQNNCQVTRNPPPLQIDQQRLIPNSKISISQVNNQKNHSHPHFNSHQHHQYNQNTTNNFHPPSSSFYYPKNNQGNDFRAYSGDYVIPSTSPYTNSPRFTNNFNENTTKSQLDFEPKNNEFYEHNSRASGSYFDYKEHERRIIRDNDSSPTELNRLDKQQADFIENEFNQIQMNNNSNEVYDKNNNFQKPSNLTLQPNIKYERNTYRNNNDQFYHEYHHESSFHYPESHAHQTQQVYVRERLQTAPSRNLNIEQYKTHRRNAAATAVALKSSLDSQQDHTSPRNINNNNNNQGFNFPANYHQPQQQQQPFLLHNELESPEIDENLAKQQLIQINRTTKTQNNHKITHQMSNLSIGSSNNDYSNGSIQQQTDYIFDDSPRPNLDDPPMANNGTYYNPHNHYQNQSRRSSSDTNPIFRDSMSKTLSMFNSIQNNSNNNNTNNSHNNSSPITRRSSNLLSPVNETNNNISVSLIHTNDYRNNSNNNNSSNAVSSSVFDHHSTHNGF